MEKRTLVAFVLALFVLLLWEMLVSSKYSWFRPSDTQPVITTPAEEKVAKESLPPIMPVTPGVLPDAHAAPAEALQQNWTIDTPFYHTQIVASGARLRSFKLDKYRVGVDANSALMELIPTQSSGFLPLALDLIAHPGWEFATRPFQSSAQQSMPLDIGQSEQNVSFWSEVPGQVKITKTFSFRPDTYFTDLTIELQNIGAEPLSDQLGISFYFQPFADAGKEDSYNKSRLAVCQNSSVKELDSKDIAKKPLSFAPPLNWIGYENNYFLQAVIPIEGVGYQIVPKILDATTGLMQVVYLTEPFQIQGGQQKSFKLRLYLGPKELSQLKEAGYDLARAADYGWFDFLARPLLHVLQWFYKYTHNYGVAIILLTVVIKVLFWPLTHKSYKSMQAMKKLQPKMTKLREKHKDNREKLNEEMMALYRAHKVNPLGGCLPMVLQIPVFFALYRMLYSSVDLLHQPFAFWINDLTAPDRLPIGFELPYLGAGLPVLTLLMGASMFIQQKMTPTTGDPRQEKMMLMMPVVFTVFFINFPSGLVLYWLVNNVLSIAQQYWINRQA
jgi:YidC/Oxa1 family membrane protein insertase